MEDLLTVGFKADEVLARYRIVVQGAEDWSVKYPAGDNAAGTIGVTQEDQATAAKDVPVRMAGISHVEAQEAIARGGLIMCEASTGKAKAATSASGVQLHIVGRALEAAAADGDIIKMLVLPNETQSD